MPDQSIIIALILTVGIGAILNLLNLVGGSLYDIKQINQLRQRKRHPYAKRYLHKPLISVIIPTHNQANETENTLKSILKSSYRKFTVIVVDDASSDNTSKFVKAFIKSHKGSTIRLMTNKRPLGRGGAINAGFKKYGRGELIMALDAGSLLDKHTLKNIVRHLTTEDFGVLAPNVRVLENPTIINLLQRFKQLDSLRPKKLNSLINAEWNVSGPGIVYKQEVFKKLKGFKSSLLKPDIALSLVIADLANKKYKLRYASDTVVYTEPVYSYVNLVFRRYRQKSGSWQALRIHHKLFFKRQKDNSKALSWFRLPMVIWSELMVLIEPLIVAYFIYVAIAFRQPVLVAIGWLVMSFLYAFTIWSDNSLAWSQKLKLIVYIPIMYPLLLVMTLIDILATVVSLMNIKKITGVKKPPVYKRSPTKKTKAKSKARTTRRQPTKKPAPATN